MENLLILGLGQEVYKMNLEHLVMPERKKRGGGKKLHNGGPYQRTPDVRALSG